MTSYTQHALSRLKEQGLRLTQPRRRVVELLDQTPVALSAYEIKDQLDSSGQQIDTVSVYRILDCLESHHLIHRVLSSGKVKKCQLDSEDACALQQDNHCHHLLICQQCGQILEIHCPETLDLLKHIKAVGEFQITGHYLEFSGLCPSCQNL